MDLFRDHGQPQMLTLKGFNPIPEIPSDYKEIEWAKLEKTVEAILNKEPLNLRLQILYQACENLCRQGHAPFMHDKLRSSFDRHVVTLLDNLKKSSATTLLFVINVQANWLEFIQKMSLIRSIFTFLDRSYALPTQGVLSVWDMGLNLFRSRVLEAPDVRTQTMEIILQRICDERNGEFVDRDFIQTLLRMVHDLGLYDKEFEVQLLGQAKAFYQHQADVLLPQLDITHHVDYIEEKIKQEQDRIQSYLARTTRGPLLEVVYNELVLKPIGTLKTKGLSILLFRSPNPLLLRKLHQLYIKAEAQSKFNELFYEELLQLGTELIKDPEQDKNMINNITDFRTTVLELMRTAFNNAQDLQRSMVRAFEGFMATRKEAPAKLLARALDQVLRAGNTQLTDSELDHKLEQLFQLFRFIQGKDVFEAFYKQSLAKRLLLSSSASYDSERTMISKLRSQLGTEYTEKLEGMFRDIELSDELTKLYKDHACASSAKFELSVNVLTQAFWPTYEPAEVLLPSNMEQSLIDFAKFYSGLHSSRRLFWQPALSRCTLQAWYGNKYKEFTVSLYQTVVLLIFNDTDMVTARKIREITGLDSDQLKLTLTSLSMSRMPILLRSSNGSKYNENVSYTYNPNFTHANVKIKVNSLQLKETVRGDNKIQEMVIHSRMHLIDAIVVRIMKTRKTMRYLDLMSETIRGLRFPAERNDIKSRIDILLERDFLARDENDSDIFTYVA